MNNKIEAHERSIADVFGDFYEFEIPPYQRPYAWTDDQAEVLLADLLDAMDNWQASGGLYFLGSVVLVKSPNQAQSKVIDGQQRLTTLTILLSILRDLTTNTEKKLKREAYVYQKADPDRGLSERYRLLLRERERPFFRKYIQEAGATNHLPDINTLEGSQKLIAENAWLLRSLLDTLPESRRDDLIAFMLQHCYMVVVAVPTAEAARRIFTVLNARGLDLTPTDILKADLLERAKKHREDELAERWEDVERRIGRERMVELFGHIRMIHEREKPRQALEVGFGKFVTVFSSSADAFVSDILEPLANAYHLLTKPEKVAERFGTEAEKAVRSLNRIDSKDWIPPALLRIWRSDIGSGVDIGNFIVDLERLAYFLFVTRAGVNERMARFSAVMDEFEPRPDHGLPVVGLDLDENEQRQFISVLSGELYQVTRVCRPVLHRLDEALSTRGATYGDFVSIEHVMPQTVDAGSEWASLFPDDELRREWTHRIANLVLLTTRVNIRASNWDFERKKKEYFCSEDGSSPFVITQGVLRAEKWTPEHLHERQCVLIAKLCQIWRLDLALVDPQLPLVAVPKVARRQPDKRIMKAKRDKIVKALSRREGLTLVVNQQVRCQSDDDHFRAVILASSRNMSSKRTELYWYAYSEASRSFLSVPRSFLVLGCMDTDTAYSLPFKELERILPDLHRTADRHWHITLHESEHGGLDLVTPRGPRFLLSKFEFGLEE